MAVKRYCDRAAANAADVVRDELISVYYNWEAAHASGLNIMSGLKKLKKSGNWVKFTQLSSGTCSLARENNSCALCDCSAMNKHPSK